MGCYQKLPAVQLDPACSCPQSESCCFSGTTCPASCRNKVTSMGPCKGALIEALSAAASDTKCGGSALCPQFDQLANAIKGACTDAEDVQISLGAVSTARWWLTVAPTLLC